MKKTFKKNKKKIIILLLLGISIGFAYLSTSLNILGDIFVRGNRWNVYWNNVQIKSGSVNASTPVIDNNKTKVNFSVTLNNPGDYFEFTVDALNTGTLDAMINNISDFNLTEEQTKFISTSVTYYEGDSVKEHQLLRAHGKATYLIRVEFKKDLSADDLPSNPSNISLSYSITYESADDTAIERDVDLLDVQLVVDNGAIELNEGDTINYSIRLINNTDSSQSFYYKYTTEPLYVVEPNSTRDLTYSWVIKSEDVSRGYVSLSTDMLVSGFNASYSSEFIYKFGNMFQDLDLYLEEQNTPQYEYRLGDTIIEKLILTNYGNSTLSNITINCDITNDNFVVPSIDPGKTLEYYFDYTIDESTLLDLNSSVLFYVTANSDDLVSELSTQTRVDNIEPKNGFLTVNIEEVNPKDEYSFEEDITIKISVRNDGNLKINNVRLICELTGDEYFYDSLDLGETKEETTYYTVTGNDVDVGKIFFEAIVTGESPDEDEPDVPFDPGELIVVTTKN